MRRTVVTTMCAVALAAACAPAAPKHDMAADVAAIGKVRDAYMAGYKAGDAAAIAALFTSDAASMTNAQPTADGPAAIQAAITAMTGMASSQELTITAAKTDVSGDMAYDRGTFKLTMAMKAGGEPMNEEGRYLVVLKRQADGSWKLAEDMSNLPTAPMPMPAAAPGKAPAGKAPAAKAPAKAPVKK